MDVPFPACPVANRHKEHSLVHNHENSLLVNIQTAPAEQISRRLTPLVEPPRLTLPLSRPMGSVQPHNMYAGRHRFFVGDVRTKIV